MLFSLFFLSTFTPQIIWENRNIDLRDGQICRVTVDGTDFGIEEPTPFSAMWFSHKLNRAGLRYEIGITIQTGDLVWINGPYPCGDWPDLRIARNGICDELDPGEKYLGDGGYRDGNQWAETPNGLNDHDQRQKQMARARHETMNGRFKQWNILKAIFRHNIAKHGAAFRAIACITQLSIQYGERLFDIDYDDAE
jgi:hypothetical protein